MQSILENLKNASNTPCFVFDRISMLDEDSKSLEFQHAHAKQYAEEAGLSIIHHFSVTETGWDQEKRRQFTKMLDLAEKFQINHLVFKNSDRLSRSSDDLKRLKDLIEEKGVTIHFFESRQSISKESTYDEKWILRLLILVAERHSDKISHDMKASNNFKIKQGILPGVSPYGYKYDKEDRTHKINPEVENTLRWVFDEFDSTDMSVHELTNLMNSKGLKTYRGGKWHRSKVHRLLTNPFYHGEFESKGEIHKGNHEPYYDKKRWQKRQLRFRHKHKQVLKHNYLLNGLIRCSCGSLFYGEKQKGITYYNHKCLDTKKNKYIQEAAIIKALDSQVEQIRLKKDHADRLKELFKSIIKNSSKSNLEDIREINTTILNLTRNRGKLYDLYLDEGLDRDALTAKIKEIEGQIKALERQRKALDSSQEAFMGTVMDVVDLWRNFTQIYSESPIEGKAEILRNTVESISYDKGLYELHYNSILRHLAKPEIAQFGIDPKCGPDETYPELVEALRLVRNDWAA